MPPYLPYTWRDYINYSLHWDTSEGDWDAIANYFATNDVNQDHSGKSGMYS